MAILGCMRGAICSCPVFVIYQWNTTRDMLNRTDHSWKQKWFEISVYKQGICNSLTMFLIGECTIQALMVICVAVFMQLDNLRIIAVGVNSEP